MLAEILDLIFKAKEKIEPGEKLTFNYLTTEWELSNKFKCECNSKNCYGKIKGFKHLSNTQKKKGISARKIVHWRAERKRRTKKLDNKEIGGAGFIA